MASASGLVRSEGHHGDMSYMNAHCSLLLIFLTTVRIIVTPK